MHIHVHTRRAEYRFSAGSIELMMACTKSVYLKLVTLLREFFHRFAQINLVRDDLKERFYSVII